MNYSCKIFHTQIRYWLHLHRKPNGWKSNYLRDDTHIDVHKNCSVFKTPYPLVHYVQNSPPPWTWKSNLRRTLPPPPRIQMITNQLKENIIQGWLWYVIRSVLQVGFRFLYELINLVWLFFDFFSFRWSLTTFFFVALYSCACSCPKISQNFFVCNYSHFWYSFCNQLVLFARLENVSKPWNNSRTVQVKERNQNKSKTKSRHIQIDEGFYCSI